MKYQEVEELVGKMRYTPNSQIECVQPLDTFDALYGGCVINILLNCPDAASKERHVEVFRSLHLCDIELAHLTPALLVKRVQLYLYALAQHEVDEFFEVDGMKVSEPHPEYHGNARTFKVSL